MSKGHQQRLDCGGDVKIKFKVGWEYILIITSSSWCGWVNIPIMLNYDVLQVWHVACVGGVTSFGVAAPAATAPWHHSMTLGCSTTPPPPSLGAL